MRASRETAEPFFTKPVTMSQEIRTYAELRQQIHNDLRIQHPEWVEPNGESPKCDFLRGTPNGRARYFHAGGSDKSIAAPLNRG